MIEIVICCLIAIVAAGVWYGIYLSYSESVDEIDKYYEMKAKEREVAFRMKIHEEAQHRIRVEHSVKLIEEVYEAIADAHKENWKDEDLIIHVTLGFMKKVCPDERCEWAIGDRGWLYGVEYVIKEGVDCNFRLMRR